MSELKDLTTYSKDTPIGLPSVGGRAGVFVPTAEFDVSTSTTIRHGAGIVGFGNPDGTLTIYYEANRFDDSSLHKWENKARKAYDRFSEDPSLERATQDRRVQKELSRAADSLRDASERLTEPPRRRHTARNILLLGILTGGLVLAFSESARKALLDAVFGEEEEFVYTSTTTAPATPSPAQSNGTPVSEVQATDSDE